MATTQLSPTATPGRRYSFSAKAEAEIVAGALLDFIAKSRAFNFNAKAKDFNFDAKSKTFNFNARNRG